MIYQKTIWIDLHNFWDNTTYNNLIIELVKKIIKNTPDFFYNIYLNPEQSNISFWENSKKIKINNSTNSIASKIKFNKILQNTKNDFVIFFDYKNQLFFKWKNILVLKDLAEIHFPKKQNFLEKYFDNFLFQKNLKKAEKIIVFDKITKEEINDKLNIFEEKIENIPWFFTQKNFENQENLIDLKIKYNIKWNFLTYSAWNWNDKNLFKFIEIFEKLEDINLIILDEQTNKDVIFRKKVIEKNLINKIFFLGDINNTEKDFFYKNSLASIFLGHYTSFPFFFNTDLNYKKTIISSKLKNISDIFWEKIIYVNQNNTQEIINSIKKLDWKTQDYTQIQEKYTIDQTTKNLINIIKNL
jgi:glycosyltransferase involved in cell wall biosynthesis